MDKLITLHLKLSLTFIQYLQFLEISFIFSLFLPSTLNFLALLNSVLNSLEQWVGKSRSHFF